MKNSIEKSLNELQKLNIQIELEVKKLHGSINDEKSKEILFNLGVANDLISNRKSFQSVDDVNNFLRKNGINS